ncbi:unnamed protein product [Prorocentrum cordatum]|uniref:Uncharacterized protein n=1 Tax=Prorocentrum cordatum TaxID=2364126 RepID=A0ABN9Y4Y4_9DINO|nr:unnamed protein product [Polarella glacialis]
MDPRLGSGEHGIPQGRARGVRGRGRHVPRGEGEKVGHGSSSWGQSEEAAGRAARREKGERVLGPAAQDAERKQIGGGGGRGAGPPEQKAQHEEAPVLRASHGAAPPARGGHIGTSSRHVRPSPPPHPSGGRARGGGEGSARGEEEEEGEEGEGENFAALTSSLGPPGLRGGSAPLPEEGGPSPARSSPQLRARRAASGLCRQPLGVKALAASALRLLVGIVEDKLGANLVAHKVHLRAYQEHDPALESTTTLTPSCVSTTSSNLLTLSV